MDIVKGRNLLLSGKTIYDMKLRVASLSRVSTDKEEQEGSLQNQLKYWKDLVDSNPNWTYVGEYYDKGKSGTQIKGRDDFIHAVEDAQLGKYDLLLTKEVTRFARNTLDSIYYTRELLKYGTIVMFTSDNICTLNPDSEFRLTIMAGMAQDEVRKYSERVKFGNSQSVKKRRVLGGGNLTGYNQVDAKLYIDETTAPIIRMAFELYSTGKYGFRTISRMLAEKGYLNSKRKQYAENVICRWIQNPKYKGTYVGRKSYIEDYLTHKKVYKPKEEWVTEDNCENVPRIVSDELWNRCNAILEKRQLEFKHTVSPKNYYEEKRKYTGLLICKEHNCSFIRKGSGQRANNPVLQCNEYLRKGRKACDSPIVYEKHLDEIFKDIIDKFLESKKDLLNTILKDYEKFIKEISNEKEISQIEKKIDIATKKKDKLLDLVTDGRITDDEFESRNKGLKREIEELTNEKLLKTNQKQSVDLYKKRIDAIEKAFSDKFNTDEYLQVLIELLVKKVFVSRIDSNRKHIKLEIIFNYDSPSLTYTQYQDQKELFKIQEKKSTGQTVYERRYNSSVVSIPAMKCLLTNNKRSRRKCYTYTTSNCYFFSY